MIERFMMRIEQGDPRGDSLVAMAGLWTAGLDTNASVAVIAAANVTFDLVDLVRDPTPIALP